MGTSIKDTLSYSYLSTSLSLRFQLLIFLQLSANLCEHSLSLVLGKEVIQPQVPLRLPCYDFTPVADSTVDGN